MTQMRSFKEDGLGKTDIFGPGGSWEGDREADGVVVRSTHLC